MFSGRVGTFGADQLPWIVCGGRLSLLLAAARVTLSASFSDLHGHERRSTQLDVARGMLNTWDPRSQNSSNEKESRGRAEERVVPSALLLIIGR